MLNFLTVLEGISNMFGAFIKEIKIILIMVGTSETANLADRTSAGVNTQPCGLLVAESQHWERPLGTETLFEEEIIDKEQMQTSWEGNPMLS